MSTDLLNVLSNRERGSCGAMRCHLRGFRPPAVRFARCASFKKLLLPKQMLRL